MHTGSQTNSEDHELTYDRSNVRRILVISFPALGDALLTTPLISALRLEYPQAELHVLVRRGVEPIFRGNPDVDQVLTIARRAPLSDGATLLHAIRRRYDLAVSTSPSDRAMFNCFAAAPYRAALVPEETAPFSQNLWLKKRILQHWEFMDHKKHFLHQTSDLLAHLGIKQTFRVTAPADPSSHDRLTKLLGRDWDAGGLVALQTSAGRPFKQWYLQGWSEVARHYAGLGHRLVYLGGPSPAEREFIDAAIEHSGIPGENLAGATSLADVSCLLTGASLYVGLDTCNSHIAAAVETPAVVLFGPTNAAKWSPYPARGSCQLTPFPAEGSATIGNVALLRPRRSNDSHPDLRNLRPSPVISAGEALLSGNQEVQGQAPG